MLKLHGIKMSNYYSLAKAALLEKGIDFEEVNDPPSQDENFLTKSPMGKVPALQTEEGFVSESFAIIEYLETIQPEPALLPADPFARAKCIELCRHAELDVELVARRCLPAAFFGATASEETQKSTQKDLAKGIKAVSRLISDGEFATGDTFTAADLYIFYSFGLSGQIAQKMFGENILADAPAIAGLIERLSSRASIQAVSA